MSLCVFVGEGKSEGIFFRNLLQARLNFAAQTAKQPMFYKSSCGRKHWLFAHPRLVGQYYSGGKKLLEKSETYKNCMPKVLNHLPLLPRGCSVHYRILRDLDNCQDLAYQKKVREKILKVADPHRVYNGSGETIHIGFCNREIESWFIASSEPGSPWFDQQKSEEIRQIFNENPDEIRNPKEKLNEVLIAEYQDNTTAIASLFGQNFDVTLAKSRSPSFADFYETFAGLI
ncbi:MAG TPA: hypothetical protein PKV72_00435 [Candidatus Peribacteria bacterium]|nr:hypothetical protein [Candidatus Peribacteria bacterium]